MEKLKGINEDRIHLSSFLIFKNILELELFKETFPTWKVRVYGDVQVYSTAGPEDGQTSYAVVSLKSQIWPGSFTIANVNFICLFNH